MKVVIRVDASLDIGTGHIMRCLTLAHALKCKGANVTFICREHIGNLIVFIQNQGFDVSVLALNERSIETARPGRNKKELSHASWLGVSQLKDAQECQGVLDKIIPRWLIVDHYGIDEVWETALHPYYQKIMVIDDLADRQHKCDLLLDQNFGKTTGQYEKLTPKHCKHLIGSQFALLRPEFFQWRSFSLERRVSRSFKHLLITMGGVDLDNFSQKILQALKGGALPDGLVITVVMGATAPHLKTVKQFAQTMPCLTEVKPNINNMAEVMANADFAIGAAGATTWERCCLGLPTVFLVLAENQKDIAEQVQKTGAAVLLDIKNVNSICESLTHLQLNVESLVKKASEITDGKGVERVLRFLE